MILFVINIILGLSKIIQMNPIDLIASVINL